MLRCAAARNSACRVASDADSPLGLGNVGYLALEAVLTVPHAAAATATGKAAVHAISASPVSPIASPSALQVHSYSPSSTRSGHSPGCELAAIEPTALFHYVSTVASRVDSAASLDDSANIDSVHQSSTTKAEHASRVADIVCNAMDGDDVRVLRTWFERFGPLMPGQCRSVARLGSESLSLYRGHAMVTAAAIAGWKAGAEAAARTAAVREMAPLAEAPTAPWLVNGCPWQLRRESA